MPLNVIKCPLPFQLMKHDKVLSRCLQNGTLGTDLFVLFVQYLLSSLKKLMLRKINYEELLSFPNHNSILIHLEDMIWTRCI